MEYKQKLSIAAQKQQSKLLLNGTAAEALRFALKEPNADIPSLQKLVMEYGDSRDIYQFADQVNGANAEEMLDEAMDKGLMKETGMYAHFLRETVKRKKTDVVINNKKLIGEVVAQFPPVKVSKQRFQS